MQPRCISRSFSLLAFGALLGASAHAAPPYDHSAIDALLARESESLSNHYAIIIRQNGVELHRATLGDIGYDTTIGLASLTKTISAAVVLQSVERGEIGLNERLGDLFPAFEANGIGDATVVDCFGMRHGIVTPLPYELLPLTLSQSVGFIAANGAQSFPPGSALLYDGNGMQSVGYACEVAAGAPWQAIAHDRLLAPCGMLATDYGQFAPNPAIAGGARSSATEIDRFASMIMAGGFVDGRQILGETSIERLFTNATQGLPVAGAPFPPGHPLYPYGEDPDYGFGAWVLAQHPESDEVEELLGAGAWGSSVWLDRRRGVTVTFLTDVQGFSQHAIDAALGIYAILRDETESHQARDLAVVADGGTDLLTWTPAPDATSARVYASNEPIRDLFDLRRAELIAETSRESIAVAARWRTTHYAVIAQFDGFENTALVPGENSVEGPTHCPADLNGNGVVAGGDLVILLGAWGTPAPGDLDGSGVVDAADLAVVLSSWGACP